MTPSKGNKTTIDLTRSKIDWKAELQLFGRSAGRCQFPGCNEFSLEHWVTKRPLIASQKAHIVAFSPEGPRGDRDFDRAKIDSFENLMFLCYRCHKEIDDNPELYPVHLLRSYKKDHEDRMYAVTGIKPETTTQVLTMSLAVRDQPSALPLDQIRRALGDTHFDKRDLISIMLPELVDGEPEYWKVVKNQIKRDVDRMLSGVVRSEARLPISVFAIGRIPLLIYLGHVLSSKVKATIFSPNYLTNEWLWIEDESKHEFSCEWIKERTGGDVLLLVCLSGKTELENLPPDVRDKSSIALLTISDGITDRGCMQRESSVHAFCAVFQRALQEIRLRKPTAFHLVPAVPVAAAVHMGRLMLPTVDPPALVYDWNGSAYQYTFTVNENDD